MFSVEIAIHKRHCSSCGGEIKKGTAHIVFGKKEMRIGHRNLCVTCVCQLLLEAMNIEERHEVQEAVSSVAAGVAQAREEGR